MLDSDRAGLYGESTKRLNEQVMRNRNRFPADFMFKLTAKEKAEVAANCDHLLEFLHFGSNGTVYVAKLWSARGRNAMDWDADIKGNVCATRGVTPRHFVLHVD